MVIYCFRKLKSSLTGPDHQYVWAHKLILSSSNLFSWKILMWHPHPYPLLLMRGSHGKEVVQLLELFIITESSKNMCLKGVWMAQGGGPCAWQHCTNKFNQSHHLKGHIQTHGGKVRTDDSEQSLLTKLDGVSPVDRRPFPMQLHQ